MPTRAALVSSALDGVQRFKQSWVSIMVLKAGVGLGQVLAMLVLILCARRRPSPLYPSHKQTEPSHACPHPQLLEAWMGVQIARLLVCWSASCWICVRARARAQAARRGAHEESQVDMSMPRVTLTTLGSHDTIAQAPEIPSSLSTFTSHTLPSLSHSSLSASGSTLVGISQTNTPDTVYASTLGSTLSLGSAGGETDDKVPRELIASEPQVSDAQAPELVVMAREMSRRSGDIAIPPRGANQPLHQNQNQNPSPSQNQSRNQSQNQSTEIDVDASAEARQRLFLRLDRYAFHLSRILGALALVLFSLGNALLIFPNRTDNQTCRHAAPLLWWGVMVVLGVGWVLFIHVFVVVVVVGIGGQAVLRLLRRLGIPTPLPQSASRPARPDPLTATELARLEVICYLPFPSDPLPDPRLDCPGPSDPRAHDRYANDTGPDGLTDTTLSSPLTSASASAIVTTLVPPSPSLGYDRTRLPYPPVMLDEHHSSCAICQEHYTPPRLGRTVLLRADPLKRLPCRHIFHAACINQWLAESAGNCPLCNASVRDGLVAA